ncbi:hypothetical protein ANO14919_059520 [Xylariales sp. No.14919]|nr:hypothetical protein ANO14919_059520 [Xylariales sp. No.14919]
MGQSKKHERSASSDLLKHPSTKRAKEVDTTDSPYKKLTARLDAHSSLSKVKSRNVLHWFRYKDLRAEDNCTLHGVVEGARKRKCPTHLLPKGEKITEFVAKRDVSHVYANHEYKVNELRLDLDFLNRVEAGRNLQFELHHDQTVVKPGTVHTKSSRHITGYG